MAARRKRNVVALCEVWKDAFEHPLAVGGSESELEAHGPSQQRRDICIDFAGEFAEMVVGFQGILRLSEPCPLCEHCCRRSPPDVRYDPSEQLRPKRNRAIPSTAGRHEKESDLANQFRRNGLNGRVVREWINASVVKVPDGYG